MTRLSLAIVLGAMSNAAALLASEDINMTTMMTSVQESTLGAGILDDAEFEERAPGWMNKNIINFVTRHFTHKAFPYKDNDGYLKIGHNRPIDPKLQNASNEPDSLTIPEAAFLAKADIEVEHQDMLKRYVFRYNTMEMPHKLGMLAASFALGRTKSSMVFGYNVDSDNVEISDKLIWLKFNNNTYIATLIRNKAFSFFNGDGTFRNHNERNKMSFEQKAFRILDHKHNQFFKVAKPLDNILTIGLGRSLVQGKPHQRGRPVGITAEEGLFMLNAHLTVAFEKADKVMRGTAWRGKLNQAHLAALGCIILVHPGAAGFHGQQALLNAIKTGQMQQAANLAGALPELESRVHLKNQVVHMLAKGTWPAASMLTLSASAEGDAVEFPTDSAEELPAELFASFQKDASEEDRVFVTQLSEEDDAVERM